MVFSSIVFLFLFLPLVLLVYHALFLPVTLGLKPRFWRRASNFFLLLVSLLFYFWGENYLIWIMVFTMIVDYLAGLFISGAFHKGRIEQLEPDAPRTARQRFGIIFSVVANLCMLGVFKYFNFGLDNYNRLVTGLGAHELALTGIARIALPLGISFYTFQSMSYTIDVYRGEVRATRNFIDFACYVTAFPQLVAGPIVRYRTVAEQLLTRTVSREQFARGVNRFVIGLGKKVLIANTVASVADKVFALPTTELTAGLAWLAIVCYTLQIYFDFSGYSDMAIGMGRMLGFEYLENFNYPYVSRSIQEFWRRWHISLSTWFRDYVYPAVGGYRRSAARRYLALLIVFFLCGLWHGASWTFVVWGLFHGLFLVLERMGFHGVLARAPRLVGHAYALIVVIVGWVLFRSESLGQAMDVLAAMTGFAQGTGAAHSVPAYLTADVALAIAVGTAFSAPLLPAFASWRDRLLAAHVKQERWLSTLSFAAARVAGLGTVFLASAFSLAAGTHNPFIYFRF